MAQNGSAPVLAPSKRSAIRSFKVMDVVAKADRLARAGREIYHLEVGQPQSSAPQPAIRVAQEQLTADRCGYTAARGEPPLRDAIARMYNETYPGVQCSPERIHLTPGSSGAFTIAFMAAFDVGDVVAVPSSCYPCYRNLLATYGCSVLSIAVDSNCAPRSLSVEAPPHQTSASSAPAHASRPRIGADNVTAKELAAAQEARTAAGVPPIKGLILSSPANPTGAMLSPEELKVRGLVAQRKSTRPCRRLRRHADDSLPTASSAPFAAATLATPSPPPPSPPPPSRPPPPSPPPSRPPPSPPPSPPQGLCERCDATGVQFISDELYHGIVYGGAPRAASALEFTKRAIVINGFSKAYSMTGWRLGWLIAPDRARDATPRSRRGARSSVPPPRLTTTHAPCRSQT